MEVIGNLAKNSVSELMGADDRLEWIKEREGSGHVARLVGASSCILKGLRFDSLPGHMPGLQVQSLVRAHTRGS